MAGKFFSLLFLQTFLHFCTEDKKNRKIYLNKITDTILLMFFIALITAGVAVVHIYIYIYIFI